MAAHKHQDTAALGLQLQPLSRYQSQHWRLAWRSGEFFFREKALESLLTMRKVMARAHSDVEERVAVGPFLRECHRVRLGRARRALDTGIHGRHRPRDLYHGWSDIKRARPAPLRASVTGAISSTLGGADGDTRRDTSADNFFKFETNVETHFNRDTNRIIC